MVSFLNRFRRNTTTKAQVNPPAVPRSIIGRLKRTSRQLNASATKLKQAANQTSGPVSESFTVAATAHANASGEIKDLVKTVEQGTNSSKLGPAINTAQVAVAQANAVIPKVVSPARSPFGFMKRTMPTRRIGPLMGIPRNVKTAQNTGIEATTSAKTMLADLTKKVVAPTNGASPITYGSGVGGGRRRTRRGRSRKGTRRH